MLTLLSIVCLCAALAVIARWYPRRVDALGRAHKFPYVAVSVLTVLGLLLALPGYLRGRQEAKLATVASVLAGREVEVHCQSFGEAFVDAGAEAGYVKFTADGQAEPSTLIKRDQCADLNSYLKSDKRNPSRAQVAAIHVLTHEAMHMRGILNEAQTECAAVQRNAYTARLLGADDAHAKEVARIYWRLIYPEMPSGYRTTECRAGGKLDEGLSDAPW